MSEMEARLEAEKQWISDIITSKLLKNDEFIKNYSETLSHTFKINDVQIKLIGGEEAFMLTMCYRARVEYEYNGSVETRSLVIKKTPELAQELFDDINFNALFNNEIIAYTKILPAFIEITGYDFNLTKFYYGEVGSNYANAIMEDFTPQGWGVAKAMTNLSLEHILLAVKYLANFHAGGFAMRESRREEFDGLVGLLKEARFVKSTIHPDYDTLLIASGERITKAIQQYQPTVPIEFAQRLETMQKKSLKHHKQRLAPIEPIITMCHGDFLRNNIAYKYKDERREEPIDVMMFDMQTLRLGSPMIDFTIFVGLTAFAEVRYKNFNLIFQTYCDQLVAAFKKYAPNATVPSFLNYDTLIKEYVRVVPYSISTAAAFLPALVEPKTDMNVQDLVNQDRTYEEIKLEALTRGGEVVDKEIAHQMKELYDLIQKYDIDVFDGCDY